MDKGFVKVACVSPNLEVGNPAYNVNEMLKVLRGIRSSIVAFPELGVSGYSCGDIFFQHGLIEDCQEALGRFLSNNTYRGVCIIGIPWDINGALYNVALVIQGGNILGIIPKCEIPNTREYYEKRWFKSGRDVNISFVNYKGKDIPFGSIIFNNKESGMRFGVEICEDMWSPITQGSILSINGANIIINISASNEVYGKSDIRKNTVLEQSRKNGGAYIYVSASISESSSEMVFSGHNIIAENGKLVEEVENFSDSTDVMYGDIDLSRINYKRRFNSTVRDPLNLYYSDYHVVDFEFEKSVISFEKEIDRTPFVPKKDVEKAFNKISSIQESALIKRLKHVGTKCIIVGVSGGLDSTLALLVAHQAFAKLGWNPKGIVAVTMPGLATSERTKNNALNIMSYLNVTSLNIGINDAVLEHFKLIEHDEKVQDVTYENSQARMRTMILMDLANKYNGFVLGTGDMSEIALGWCTFNGDQMSMYGINAGVPKTLVRFMVEAYGKYKYQLVEETLLDIVRTPITPELSNKPETEEQIGKYKINDYILYRFLECGDNIDRIKWLVENVFILDQKEVTKYVSSFFKRFYSQQYKRQSLPDGPKVLDISLSPRTDFRMPSDLKR